MSLLEIARTVLGSIQLGEEIGNKLFVGEHADDIARASELYHTISEKTENKDDVLREVITLLAPVSESDKAYIWANACIQKAQCFYDLEDFEQAKRWCAEVLKINIDKFTVGKDAIRDFKEAAILLLANCILFEILPMMGEYDEKDVEICQKLLCRVLRFATISPTEVDELYSFYKFNIANYCIPWLFEGIEKEFSVFLNDEKLIGKRRDELRFKIDYEHLYKDIEITTLVRVIKLSLPIDPFAESTTESKDVSQQQIKSIRELLLEIIGEQLGVCDNLDETASFKNELNCDSLGFINILLEIEKKLSLTISKSILYQHRIVVLEDDIILPDDFLVKDLIKIVINLAGAINQDEQNYLEMYKEYALDGEISDQDWEKLNQLRYCLGISKERARELEASYSQLPQLTEDEEAYLGYYRSISKGGELLGRDRKMLNLMRERLGISEERAKEIELM